MIRSSESIRRTSLHQQSAEIKEQGHLSKDLMSMHSDTAEARSAGVVHRILVVDDNQDSAECLTMLLRLIGHEVHTAHDGLEAVEAAKKFQPGVILLDIGLPRLNGYEAARRIRGQQRDKGLMLIALTGWSQEEDRRCSEEAGFDTHLVTTDLLIPNSNGIAPSCGGALDLISRLRLASNNVKVLVYSALCCESSLYKQAIALGADACLAKDAPIDNFKQTINNLLGLGR